MSSVLTWEALDPESPDVDRARELFEATQPLDERIPWEWIVRSVKRRPEWRPGRWSPHLLVAALREGKKIGTVTGFATGMYFPGFGGYMSYIGVDRIRRGQGVGTRLIQLLGHVLAADASGTGEELPFIVWESRPPVANDENGGAAWRSRLRLFERVGAKWIGGVSFHAVSYTSDNDTPIPLQLFVLPGPGKSDELASQEALIQIITGLGQEVYQLKRTHPFMLQTLPTGVKLELRPVGEAMELRRE